MQSNSLSPENLLKTFEKVSVQLRQARSALGEVVFGQDEVIDQVLTALVAGGHALLVGAPGLAKTLLVSSTATVTGLSDRRIQFTPDLMPSDVLGAEVLDELPDGKRAFRFIEGPGILPAPDGRRNQSGQARAPSLPCCRRCRKNM